MNPSPVPIVLQISYFKQSDTTGVIIGAALAVGIVVALVVAGLVTGGRGGTAGRKRAARFGRNAWRRTAKAHGLSPAHIATLEGLVTALRIGQPMLLFTSSGLLDETLRKGIYQLNANHELSEEERQRRLGTMLQIKQLIEKNARRGATVISTQTLSPGQSLTITLPDGAGFPTRVTHNLRRMLACEIPAGIDRNKWRKGTPVKAMLWRQGDSGYAFQSKILAYDTIGGRPVVLLQHTRTMRRSQRRTNRRREIRRSCFFYPVVIMETGSGRSARKQAVVQESFRHLGTLLDISAGGCAIATQVPLAKGRLLRIDFELGARRGVAVYGKIQRSNPAGAGRQSTMHIMFTRVSTRQMNEILSFVYDFEAAAPKRTARAARTR